MIFLVSFQAFAIGSLDDFSAEHVKEFEKFINTTTVYTAFVAPWTKEPATLNALQLRLEAAMNDSKQPIIIWDPVLPRNYPDSMNAILLGLEDEYIEAFMQVITNVQTKYPQLVPIIQMGTSVNSYQSYTTNASLFVQVYQKIVVMFKQKKIAAKFAVNYAASQCQDPDLNGDTTAQCTDGWFFNEVTQQLEPCPETPGDDTQFVVTDTSNPFLRMTCKREPKELYPGDSFVDWISIQMVNEDKYESGSNLIHKGVQLAERLSKGKPVMWFVGSVSIDGSEKEGYIKTMQDLAIKYSRQTAFSSQVLRSLILICRETNRDVALYDSVKGTIPSSTTQNGVVLYSYENLQNMFKDNRENLVQTIDLKAAASGSVCGAGEYAELSFSGCAPCQTGTYSSKSGQVKCDPCPVGQYQDVPGSFSCKKCPGEHASTASNGTQREEYCVCLYNYFKNQTTSFCDACPRNTYSKTGGNCVSCPADAKFKAGKGKAGGGCFCLHGYHWDSQAGECQKGSADSSVSFVAAVGLFAAGAIGFALLL